MKKFIFLTILVIFLLSNVAALGVTPARKTLDFSSNYQGKASFTIINSESKQFNLVIQTRGELANNIILNTRRVSLEATDKESTVEYTIELPSTLSPGLHIGEIVISESPEEITGEETVVGATLSVVTQVYVYVSYPGKYAEAKLNIKSANAGEDVSFIMPVVSMGEFDLVNVYANVDIFSGTNEKIDSFNTQSIQIKSGEKADIIHNWKADVPVGNYKAVATIIYDGETINLEDTFQVGGKLLELQQITVNNFQLGEIAKMELLLENKWSETIENIHTQMQIFSTTGDILADFNSPDTSIDPFNKKVLTSFWDTAGVRKGTYDTKVIIHYAGDKTVDTDLQLIVDDNRIDVIGLGYVLSEKGGAGFNVSENLVTILIIVIGILILLNILWFLILRRYLKKKS